MMEPAWSATWGGIFWNSHSSSPLGCWPRSSRTPEQQSWTQVLLQVGPLSPSLVRVTVLNVLIEKVIFGNILGINRTLDSKFSPHCSSINYFNQIYEVLFGFETSHKLSVIWRPRRHRRQTVSLRTSSNYFRIDKRNSSPVPFFQSGRLKTQTWQWLSICDYRVHLKHD